MGMPQQLRDSVGDSVIIELYLVLNRPGGFQNGFEQGICSLLPCHVRQKSHSNTNVEIQLESLGIVRDGSRSTPEKSVYCKGYHVTD